MANDKNFVVKNGLDVGQDITANTITANTVTATLDGTANNATNLNGQAASYYLDYTNVTNKPTIGNATVTISAGGGLSTGGNFTTNQTSNETITINHADTSTQATVNNTGATFIQDVTLDTYGHVTSLGSVAITPGTIGAATSAQGSTADSAIQPGDNISELTNDAGFTTNIGDITGVTAGSGITGGGTSGTVTINHADTSSQASVNNSNGTVIQDILLDTYGHITSITSADLDGRYYTETEADSRFVNVAGDTMTGDLKIEKTDAAIYLNDSSGSPTQQGIRIRAESIDTNLPNSEGIGIIFEEDPANGSPDTTPAVITTGEFYAQSDQRVFHDAYHPNADTWTTARTISLGGDLSGSVSINGSSNVTLTAIIADDSHNHIISNVDGLQTALNAKAPLASPALTGTPTAPTAAAGTNTTQIATTAFVSGAVSDLVDASPAALDTLNELAAALGDDPNFATTVSTQIGTKADKTITISAGDGLTGGGDLSANRTISHADTSTLSGTYGSTADGTKIDQITVDDKGHVTSITTGATGSGSMSSFNIQSNSGTQVAISNGEEVNFINGDATTVTVTNQANPTVQVNHADTSSQASVDNSGGTVIQDITLDGYGHITAIASSNLDGRYYTESEADSRFVNVAGDTLTGTLNYRMLVNQTTSNYDTAGDASGFSVFYGTSAATNKPSGTDHAVATFSYSDAWQTQLAMDWRTNSAYLRTQENGTWKSWNQLFTDGYHPNADKWTTARTLSLSGDASGSVSWDGSGNATLSVTVANDSHTHDGRYYTETEADSRFVNVAGDTMSGVLTLEGTNQYPLNIYNNTNGGGAGIAFSDVATSQLQKGYFYFDHQDGDSNGDGASFHFDTTEASLAIIAPSTGNYYVGTNKVFHDAYHPNADKWTTARTLSLSGAVTGSASIDGSGNVTLATTATADPTLTLSGDASGSATFTNLGNATLNVTVANDSHTHDGRYYTETEADSRFVNVAGDAMTGTLTVPDLNASRYFQTATGVPTNNLGSPTVTEMALFDAQFTNKTAFHPTTHVFFETSTDNINWSEFVVSDTVKKRFFGGDRAGTSIAIPYNTAYFRVRIKAVSYVFLNALYSYWSGSGHSTKVQIYKKLYNSSVWTQHTSSNTAVSSWPGHLYLPFSTIPFNPSNASQYDEVSIVFIPNWNASFPSNSISLYNMAVWGGYPSGRRNIYSVDENKNIFAPSLLYVNDTTDKVFSDSYHPNADTWTTARTLSLSGDASGSVSWDGSGNATLSVTIADDSHNHTIANVDGLQTALNAKVPTSRTITAGGGLTGGGDLTANRTISHADTSTQASVNNSGRTYIQDITLDGYGHITGITSATETVVNTDTNTTYSISAVDSGANAIIRLTAGGSGSGTDDVTLVAGSNVTLTPSNDNITIAATNTTYSAGNGISLSGTTFSVAGGTSLTQDASGLSVTANGITATQLNVSGNGTAGQALLSDGDGSFSWGEAGSSVTVSATAPSSPSEGELWWDEDVGNMFIYYNDGTSSQWVEASPNPKALVYNAGTSTYTLTGNLTVTGDLNSNSDEKLKDNINTFEGGLEAVNALRGVRYDWKENGKSSIGLIAQEVEKVLPELVSEQDDIKSIQYGNIVAVLIEAVKELSAKVEELENK